ncbi:hypothetical protein HID58_081157 [Brassica napus]|uniref:(rape) hypothetical protein n=1 Tax=Brassica napus TaxID=3708 RepID=A0A816UGG7_BRANA|nr:uncharacterized protein LOC106362091 [Brassica napus]KAH0863946.1 hypothetical protein HID58_081157 [Brassica napus]CAF2108772.1 unnamed protein product [Brassica napus]
MGTKVHSETILPRRYHHSMRDLNNDSNGCSRLPFLNNDQSYKDMVRRTMLEHEAAFKSQVLELHRVYGIQKDMMDELKRKQFNKELFPVEASCSSQATTNDDVRKWKTPSFPVANSVYDRPSMSVVEDNGHSPMKGASSKHVEALEIRPTKIRRRMIDLCLPADEYIDDSEDVVVLKDHRQLPNGAEPRGGDGLRIGSRSNGLADLNEPFKAQDTNEVAYGNFQSHVRDYGKVLNSGSVREQHVPVISLQPGENGKPKAWPQHQPLRIDHYTGTHNKSATPFLQPGKPQRVMGLANAGPPPSKADLWRGKTFIDLEADTDTDTNTIHESSSFASHQQPQRHLYPYNPPESAVPWNRSHSSWQNPSFAFPQRVERYPVLNLSDTNAQKLGGLGDRLQFESNARYNTNHNMFYNECSSSSKSKGTGYSYPNGGRSDHSLLDLNGSEVKSVRDLNLNVTLSNTSVVEVRNEHDVATLPWLVKPKPVSDGRWNLNSKDTVPSPSLKPSNIIKEEAGNLMWLERLKSGSCSSKPETDKIRAGTAYRDESNAERDKVRIMLDINEPCEEEQTETKVSVSSKCQFDLNMSVSEDEDESWSAPPTSSKLSSKRLMIDLETVPESDVEEEDLSGEKTSEETPKPLEKPPEFEKTAAETIVAISSEAVASSEAPETVILHWFAETVDTHKENLDQKLASLSRSQVRSIEEIDYFESMTLQLPEITEEQYTPKPLVPEDLVLEETSVATSQRPRRGNARKGKQRRDFQRDILPGLLSLSKHEVTEDIQLFDGFMRAATGSSWTPTGLTRKKTGARGRPRRVITNPEPVVYYPVQAPPPCPTSVQQQVGNNGEIEDGSFGGWGKMTRRPRRQRCPSSSTVTTSVTTNVHHHTRMSRNGWE